MRAACNAFEKRLRLLVETKEQSIFYPQICNLNKKLKVTEYFGSNFFRRLFICSDIRLSLCKSKIYVG
jgi:hypothetical protein